MDHRNFEHKSYKMQNQIQKQQLWPDCSSSSQTIRLNSPGNKTPQQRQWNSQARMETSHFQNQQASSKPLAKIVAQPYTSKRIKLIQNPNSRNKLCIKQLDMFQTLIEQRRSINSLISHTHLKMTERDNQMIAFKSKELQEQINHRTHQFKTIDISKSQIINVRQQARNEMQELDLNEQYRALNSQNDFRTSSRTRNGKLPQSNSYCGIAEPSGIKSMSQFKQHPDEIESIRFNTRTTTGKTTVNNMPDLQFHAYASENRYLESKKPEITINCPSGITPTHNQEIHQMCQQQELNFETSCNKASERKQNRLPPLKQIQQSSKSQVLFTGQGIPIYQIPHTTQNEKAPNLIFTEDNTNRVSQNYADQIQKQNMDSYENADVVEEMLYHDNQKVDQLSNSKLIEEINRRLNSDNEFKDVMLNKCIASKGSVSQSEEQQNKYVQKMQSKNINTKSIKITRHDDRSNQNYNKKLQNEPFNQKLSNPGIDLDGKKIQELQCPNQNRNIQHSMLVNLMPNNQIKFDQESQMYQYDDNENPMPVMNQTIKTDDHFNNMNQKTEEQTNNEQESEEGPEQMITKELKDYMELSQQSMKRSDVNQEQKMDNGAQIRRGVWKHIFMLVKKNLEKYDDLPKELKDKINEMNSDNIEESSGGNSFKVFGKGKLSKTLQNQALSFIIQQQLDKYLVDGKKKKNQPFLLEKEIMLQHSEDDLNQQSENQDEDSEGQSSEYEQDKFDKEQLQRKSQRFDQLLESMEKEDNSELSHQSKQEPKPEEQPLIYLKPSLTISKSSLCPITEENNDNSLINSHKQNVADKNLSISSRLEVVKENVPEGQTSKIQYIDKQQAAKGSHDIQVSQSSSRSLQSFLQQSNSLLKLKQNIKMKSPGIQIVPAQKNELGTFGVFRNHTIVQNSDIKIKSADIIEKEDSSKSMNKDDEKLSPQIRVPYVTNENIKKDQTQSSLTLDLLKDKQGKHHRNLKIPVSKTNNNTSRRQSKTIAVKPPEGTRFQRAKLEEANLNFTSTISQSQSIMPKVQPLRLNIVNKQTGQNVENQSARSGLTSKFMASQKGQSTTPSKAKSIHKFESIESKSSQKLDVVKPRSRRGSIQKQPVPVVKILSPSKTIIKLKNDILAKNNFDMDAFREGRIKRYFMPIQVLEKQKHKKKVNLKLGQGMVTIKWKKGKESLGIGIGSENPSEVFNNKSNQDSKELLKEGYGKFQTYANFLRGEEKEQYEKYIENKQKKD